MCTDENLRRLHVFYSGTVQGVGFRYTALAKARRFQVAGWVRNRSDGRVELLAEGNEEELERLYGAIKGAMEGYIANAKRTWENPTGEFNSFEIGPTA